MSFLTYNTGDEVQIPALPRRVYGRVDAFEPPDEGWPWTPTILLDSLDADWFDARGSDIRWLGAPDVLDDADRRIATVAAKEGRLPRSPA
jgi:hypothetical protein